MIVTFTTVLTPSQVSAKTFEVTQKTNIALDKIWNIKMTQLISNEGLTEKVVVKDSAGAIVQTIVTVGEDGRTICVAPVVNYEDGKTYELLVSEGIESKDKKSKLTDAINMKFKVSKDAYNMITEKIEVYLNGAKMAFNEGLQPKSIEGIANLPLEVMAKATGFDMEIWMDMKPNIVVDGPLGDVTASFNDVNVASPNGLVDLNGRVTLATDLKGKYIGTYVGSNFFDNLGFKTSNILTRPDMSLDVVVHVMNLDGKVENGGKLTFKDNSVVVILPSPLDYVMKPNEPSVDKYPTTMKNLQALVKLIPKKVINENRASYFWYNGDQFMVTSQYYNDFEQLGNPYQEIGLIGDLQSNPIGVKLINSILYDTVGEADAKEIYSALLKYSTGYETDDGTVSAIEKKYSNYMYTGSKKNQYKIIHDFNHIYVNYK